MSTATWFITGTNRGLGFEFVRQLVASPSNTVFAACRNPDGADKLKVLESTAKGKLHIVQLDQEDEESIKTAAETVEKLLDGRGLDYLLNSAAKQYAGDDRVLTLKPDEFMNTIKNCVLGPALILQSFVPLVEKSERKVIMNMSSGLGSIGIDLGPKNVSYSVAKTALNMLNYKLSKSKPHLIAFVMDPGWVRTDMGGPEAVLEPEFSISNMLRVLTTVTSKDTGTYKRYNGEPIPW